MYLKELNIFGFKSFPIRVSLKFDKGINAVVGPNGCGKSNVLDAIKWALGEQSPKSLRGSKMEDIIFNGTEHHPPLNYAEVVLTFSNEDKYLPIEYTEVSVGRRLYRSGESQYFINKNPVRLKDVEELFMGSGIGSSTYSFIEQGKIEIFLQLKPEEKRQIFDEASGIIKYKERKKEALRKLSATEENILRLDDIISEVKRQINYLQRQVERAKEYKKLQEELIGEEKKLAAVKLNRLNNTRAEVIKTVDELSRKENEIKIFISHLKEELSRKEAEIENFHKQLDEVNSQIFSQGSEKETALKTIDLYSQRIDEITLRNETLEKNIKLQEERLLKQKEKFKLEEERAASLDNLLKEIEEKLQDIIRERKQIEENIETAKKEIAVLKEEIWKGEAELVNVQNSIVENEAHISSLERRKLRLELDREKLSTFLKEKSEQVQKLTLEGDSLKTNLNNLKSRKELICKKKKQLKILQEETRSALMDKEKENAELRYTWEFLKDLRIKYDKFSSSQKINIIFPQEPQGINKLIISLEGANFRHQEGGWQVEVEAKIISLGEKELEEKLRVNEEEIEKIKLRIKELQKEEEDIDREEEVYFTKYSEQEKTLSEYLRNKELLEKDKLNIEEEIFSLQEESTALDNELDNLRRKKEAGQSRYEELSLLLKEKKDKLNNREEFILNSTSDINNFDVEYAKKDQQRQSLVKEKENFSSRINFLKEEEINLQQEITRFLKEKENNITTSDNLRAQINNLKIKVEEAEENIKQLIEKRENIKKERSFLFLAIEEGKQKIATVEDDLGKLQQEIYQKKAQIQNTEYEIQKIKDYLWQVYNAKILDEELSLPEAEEEVIKSRVETLKNKVSRFGEVNMVALEEFDELNQRYDFLNRQREDLITSKENLKKGISKINKTSREQFLKTFNLIKDEFYKNFRFLFGGGRGELLLLDEGDVLEAGVDIQVQPPGKKLQNISLLSGGEKALVAIALIFSIFKVNPSPLCVLDEIDAPLDEANVDRFNHMIKNFSLHSQFIIITHNKKTMSTADLLYGVTMEEKGISKLVSVKFAENAPSYSGA